MSFFDTASWSCALICSGLVARGTSLVSLTSCPPGQCYCVANRLRVAKCTFMAIGLLRLRYRHRRSLSLLSSRCAFVKICRHLLAVHRYEGP